MDWAQVLGSGIRVHGIRIDIPDLTSVSAEAKLTERRILEIMRLFLPSHRFALRRSFREGPARIECAFVDAVGADKLAKLIDAKPVPPPVGFNTFHLLVAAEGHCQRIRKLGQDKTVYPKKKMLDRLAFVLSPT